MVMNCNKLRAQSKPSSQAQWSALHLAEPGDTPPKMVAGDVSLSINTQPR